MDGVVTFGPGEGCLIGDAVSRVVEARLAEAERDWLAWSFIGMRERVRETVRFASPLLADLAGREHLDIDALARMIAPGWLSETGELRWRGGAYRHLTWGRPALWASSSGSRLDVDGWVLRGRLHPRGRLGIAAVDGFIDAIADLQGGARLVTRGATAMLKLRATLPATILASCIGWPVDRLVGSELLDGRGYRILSATTAGTRGLLITFDIGRVSYEVPW